MDKQLVAEGVNGQLTVMPTKVMISRKGMLGFLTQGFKGEKEIRIEQITSIQFKKAGMLTNGYIQFAFIGGQETKGGLFNATQDENTVMFNTIQQRSFLRAKDLIEQNQLNLTKHSPSTNSGIEDLEKLASLYEKGILTQGEFEAKKKQILGI